MNGKAEDEVNLEDKTQENSESGSWTSSDERSSGNEYSVKLRNELLSDEEALKELYERKKKRHKKRKKRRKKKHEKTENYSSDEESIRNIVNSKSVSDKKTLMIKVDEILESCVSNDIQSVIENASSNGNDKDAEERPASRSRSGRSQSKDQKRSQSSERTRSSRKKSRSRSKSKDRKSKGRSSSRSRTRHRSRSRSKDRRRLRSSSRNHRRSRSRSKDRRRLRSRSRNRRRSKSKDRRRRSQSRSRDRRHSRSRSRDHRPSRSRSRDRRRSRSRSRDRRRRSRSRSRDRRRSMSTSKYKREEEDSKETSTQSSLWDVKTVNEPVEVDTNSVFQKVSALRRTGIAINYGNTVTSENNVSQIKEKQKIENKSNPYGKWEPVSNDKKGTDLSKYMKICQEISAKESIYENHVVDSQQSSDEEESRNIHHPFVAKPAPILPPPSFTSRVPMNPAQAIMAGMMNSIAANPADIISGPLEKHFPVSTGTDHREKESVRGEDADLPVYSESANTEEPINVSAIIARRMGAQQILNSNPHESAARKVLDECDLKLKGWTERNRKPGKFTGERGVRMDKKEIAGAIETWVRKDFFHNLMPLCGGVGMRMMQNMGWKQGTPLGKNNEGYVAPITFDVKVGRGGLASEEEQPAQGRGGGFGNHLPKKRLTPVQNVGGKHPVSALAEICTKKRLGQPEYTCVFESGSAHNKTFLIKCTIQNVDYQPSVASPNKKHAKAQAALTAVKILGLE